MIAADSIQASVARIDELLNKLKGHLNGARGAGVPEFARQEIASATVMIASVRAECNAIKTELATARMTGQAVKPVAAEDLELRPTKLPAQVEHEKLLAGLHRVADHTLDEDDEGRDG